MAAPARVGSLPGAVLELQRSAGNAAVATLIGTVPREVTGAAAPGAPGGGPASPPATPASVPPPLEGRDIDLLGVVDQDGTKSKDGRPGLNLRAAPSDAAQVPILGRLDHDDKHDDHLIAKKEMPGDWFYAVVTDGRLRGTAGYVSSRYVNTQLPPEPSAPDPGARLYRIKPNERAHQLVRDAFGAENISGGQDQRFFTNVLQYVNDRAKRGDALRTKEKRKQWSEALIRQ